MTKSNKQNHMSHKRSQNKPNLNLYIYHQEKYTALYKVGFGVYGASVREVVYCD